MNENNIHPTTLTTSLCYYCVQFLGERENVSEKRKSFQRTRSLRDDDDVLHDNEIYSLDFDLDSASTFISPFSLARYAPLLSEHCNLKGRSSSREVQVSV